MHVSDTRVKNKDEIVAFKCCQRELQVVERLVSAPNHHQLLVTDAYRRQLQPAAEVLITRSLGEKKMKR